LWIFIAIAILSLLGLADAIYLTVGHLTGRDLQCTVVHGCSKVLGSDYAKIGSIPVATLGAVAYFTVFSLSTLTCFGYKHTALLLRYIIFSMLLVTLYLIYIQAFVLHAFCSYCLLSAILVSLMTLLTFLDTFISKKLNSDLSSSV
jgi:uncharacterized membrane protein